MKTARQMMLVALWSLFWAVALPLAGLFEVGVLIADSVEGHTKGAFASQ